MNRRGDYIFRDQQEPVHQDCLIDFDPENPYALNECKVYHCANCPKKSDKLHRQKSNYGNNHLFMKNPFLKDSFINDQLSSDDVSVDEDYMENETMKLEQNMLNMLNMGGNQDDFLLKNLKQLQKLIKLEKQRHSQQVNDNENESLTEEQQIARKEQLQLIQEQKSKIKSMLGSKPTRIKIIQKNAQNPEENIVREHITFMDPKEFTKTLKELPQEEVESFLQGLGFDKKAQGSQRQQQRLQVNIFNNNNVKNDNKKQEDNKNINNNNNNKQSLKSLFSEFVQQEGKNNQQQEQKEEEEEPKNLFKLATNNIFNKNNNNQEKEIKQQQQEQQEQKQQLEQKQGSSKEDLPEINKQISHATDKTGSTCADSVQCNENKNCNKNKENKDNKSNRSEDDEDVDFQEIDEEEVEEERNQVYEQDLQEYQEEEDSYDSQQFENEEEEDQEQEQQQQQQNNNNNSQQQQSDVWDKKIRGGCRVIIKNLNPVMGEEGIRQLLNCFGEMLQCTFNKKGQEEALDAYVNYADPMSAQEAIFNFDQQVFEDRLIQVQIVN